ncbi:hypothetical protein [Streptomyces zagrosensis]|uniref:Uncharacterized protein n=1 Tax=Streptomyces zagrosensis TaxID=1042984 RepID=A0A7W9QGX7_9ACTN|nr:hypothetical protein [Streptomyces zagrosensis]MBB5939936.1 hypothetical protein [Streptomyces zagrosensis]
MAAAVPALVRIEPLSTDKDRSHRSRPRSADTLAYVRQLAKPAIRR